MTQPTRPRAVVDHAALRGNAERLVADGGPRLADVRADAYGHGLPETAATLAAAGMRLLVDGDDARRRLCARGVAERDVTCDPDAVADPRTLWGLPGGHGTAVMRLHGSLLSVKPLLRGEGVSYGYTYRATADTVVGLVSGGYAQGVVREVGNIAHVCVGAVPVAVVGRVAMDACVVELGDVPATPGADVVFFGDPARGHPPLEAWTTATGMQGLEIVSLAGARVRREHVG